MFRLPHKFLRCPAAATTAASLQMVAHHPATTTESLNASVAQPQQHLLFASGYKVPDAVSELIQKEVVAARGKPYASRVWFTESQLRMMRIKLKEGEAPLHIDCPAGTTRVPSLTLFNAEQTAHDANFFPPLLRGLGATNNAEFAKKRYQQKMLQKQQGIDEHFASMKHQQQQQQGDEALVGDADADTADTADASAGPLRHDPTGATTPQYAGGVQASTSSVTRMMQPKYLWATLASVAAQHKWSSSTWFSRVQMRQCGLRPKVSFAAASGGGGGGGTTTTALPLIVRMHGTALTSAPSFQALWNEKQLEPDTSAETAAAVAAEQPKDLADALAKATPKSFAYALSMFDVDEDGCIVPPANSGSGGGRDIEDELEDGLFGDDAPCCSSTDGEK